MVSLPLFLSSCSFPSCGGSEAWAVSAEGKFCEFVCTALGVLGVSGDSFLWSTRPGGCAQLGLPEKQFYHRWNLAVTLSRSGPLSPWFCHFHSTCSWDWTQKPVGTRPAFRAAASGALEGLPAKLSFCLLLSFMQSGSCLVYL